MNPPPEAQEPRPRSRVRDFWTLDVPLAIALIICTTATVVELRRATEGNWRAWVYSVEWPMIGAFCVWMWIRFRRQGASVSGSVSGMAQRWRDRAESYANEDLQEPASAPVMSHTLLRNKVIPQLEKEVPLFFILIDNLRFDQWKAIEPVLLQNFRRTEEDSFYSILPTATQYARNAIFSGLLPMDMQKQYPQYFKHDEEEGGKNLFEEELLRAQLQRLGKGSLRVHYTKVLNNQSGLELQQQIHNLMGNNLNIIVYNFVDMLSHARTEMEVLKELAGDESSYRSVTASWFEHSPLHQALKRIADKRCKIVLATDHGSIRVHTPCKVLGDRQTTTNLRYKHGRNLQYEPKDVLAFRNPLLAGLPSPAINSSYIFAKGDHYLCYPNNYNHYVNYYRNTFQHGGISLEEMIVPVITLQSRNFVNPYEVQSDNP